MHRTNGNERPSIGRLGGHDTLSGPGILDQRALPDEEFDGLWATIIVDERIKERLLCQAVLNFTLRPVLRKAALPLHGVILLVGPPGTGKTSLGRGLASRVAATTKAPEPFRYLEVEPHGLASAALGKSQQAVSKLLGGTVAELAQAGPLVVLLDEVETLAADRSRMSLEANPIDVHRATDAVLAQLDHLATASPNVLFIATSNFAAAIDQAFVSRADMVVSIDLPSREACERIIRDTLTVLGSAYPKVGALAGHAAIPAVADLCHGLDGRTVRKVVLSALAEDKRTALDPSRLTIEQLTHAAKLAADCRTDRRNSR